MKKVAFIIASKEFRDEEYFITKEELEKLEIRVDTFSDTKGMALGRFGGEVSIDKEIEDVDVGKYDGIVFIGGSGALKCLNNQSSYDLIDAFSDSDKVVGAICISPVILARTGILEGKKATVWSSNLDKSAIKIIKENGGEYQDLPVVIDGNIITARDFEASREFAQAIFSLLK